MNLLILLQGGVGVAIVASFVQALKKAGVPTNWLPLIAWIVGAAYGLTIGYIMEHDWLTAAVAGILVGAMASSGYDQVKGIQDSDVVSRLFKA